MSELSFKERAAVIILLFIVRLLNPTGYPHQVDALKKELEEIGK